MFGDTEKVCTLRIGMALTTSSETPIIQITTDRLRRPPAVAELHLGGERTDRADRARRRGHADEVLLLVGGLVGVEHRVEPGQPQHDADRVEQHHDPADLRVRQQRARRR